MGTRQCLHLVFIRVNQRRQLIKSKGNICPNSCLDLHRQLWRKFMQRTIEVRLKHHTIIIHPGVPTRLLGNRNLFINISAHRQHLLKARAEAQHLKAAAVGKGRAAPVHKLAQISGLLY